MQHSNKAILSRDESVKILDKQIVWDVIVIGGGATGLGVAVDAASRGCKTLLLEANDFAKGTSSRSTKLIHGGVRYLAQGHVGLVFSALKERGRLLRNAAHLVKPLSFIIPCYTWFEKWKYLIGLKFYDWLSGTLSLGSSSFLNADRIADHLPNINKQKLVGGIEYFDGQFDDARLAINLAQTCCEQGGAVLNYFKVTGLIKKDNKIIGVIALDVESNKEFQLEAKVVINAAGIFVNEILTIDDAHNKTLVRPSQGIHLVFHKRFLNGDSAIMIPKTTDGRVLFAIPWHEHVLIGTTDTAIDKFSIEPVALEKEIEFILQTVKQYLAIPPSRKDVLSAFAGLRPLAIQQKMIATTKEISRDHKVIVSASGLVTITGGKWTTYRKMAEDTVNKAIKVAQLEPVACKTASLQIHGCTTSTIKNRLNIYGTDASFIEQLISNQPSLNKKLVELLPYTEAEVIWVVRNEMARTIEDVLARRLRILFLDACAAIEAAPRVAKLMADELGCDEEWKMLQIASFTKLAQQYLVTDTNTTKTNTA